MNQEYKTEIDVMVRAYLGDCGPQANHIYNFVQAVLAKWGTPTEWLEQAYREGWAACRDAETIGGESEDWSFGNSTANSRMIDAQQAVHQPAPTTQAAPAAGAVAGSAEPTQEMIAAVLRLVDLGQSDPEDHRYDDGSKLATQICRAVLAAAPTTAAQANSQPAPQGETNVQLDTDSNPTAPGQQRDMAGSVALGQPMGYGQDQASGNPGAQRDKLLTVAERNIRSFLRSAVFKSESDREAALSCVDVLRDAARAQADSVLEDAARWQDHVGKLDALVAYCPTCCQGFIAKQDMTRDEVLFACGKAVGQSGAKRLGEALDLAVDHIDMNALRISHCKDAAAIDAARKQGKPDDYQPKII